MPISGCKIKFLVLSKALLCIQWILVVTALFDVKPQTIISCRSLIQTGPPTTYQKLLYCLHQIKTWTQVMTFPFTILWNGFINHLRPIASIPCLMVMYDVPTLNQSFRNDWSSAEAEWSCLAGRQSPSFLDAFTLQRTSSGLVWSTTEELVFQIRSFHSYICGGVSCFNQVFILDIFDIFFRRHFWKKCYDVLLDVSNVTWPSFHVQIFEIWRRIFAVLQRLEGNRNEFFKRFLCC